MKIQSTWNACHLALAGVMAFGTAAAQALAQQTDKSEVKAEHAAIGIDPKHHADNQHTRHPDAQWFPDAGLGLFLHWDLACTRPINIGWSMIPGRKLVGKDIKPAEFERIVREQDFNLDGKKWPITPNEYWALAKDFKPDNYHPEVWLKKAREAGFTYAVLTTKHHGGFAMWPTAYGDYNTKNYMHGRDLVKDYVDACRKVGLKVGLYYSGPDWYFEREFKDFLYRPLPGLPALGPDLQPRTLRRTPEDIAKHHKAYAAMVRGQVEELMTNYGKIDLLWFDGRPPIPGGNNVISQERIRELQPGIVINTRMHGKGDYITPERVLPDGLVLKGDEWGEFCSPWNYWSYVKTPFRPLDAVLTELARSRNAGVNYLLGFGPMGNGDLAPEAYENMARLGAWMRTHSEAVYGTRALPPGESCSVPASSKGAVRYLYLVPAKKGVPQEVTFKGLAVDCRVMLLGDTREMKVSRAGGAITIDLRGENLGQGVRVLKLAPLPAQADVAYGQHERHALDSWQAKSDKPIPMVFYIHGGAWNHGDKTAIDRGLEAVVN